MKRIQLCPKCDTVMSGDETGHLTCPNCSLYLNIAFFIFQEHASQPKDPQRRDPHPVSVAQPC